MQRAAVVSTPELKHVATVQAEVDAADLEVRAAVAAARGETWRQVGERVGISKDAAYQRWGAGHEAAWRAKRPPTDNGSPLRAEPRLPVLERVARAQDALDEARHALPGAMAAARAAGEQWRAIGQALGGVTKQAAYQRFGPNPDLPPRAH